MKLRGAARKISSGFGLLATLSLIACSFGIEFVVVNDSASPVQVHYTFKDHVNFGLTFPTATLPSSELGGWREGWQQLSAEQYTLDPQNRTIVVRLKPNEAFRLAIVKDKVDEKAERFFYIEKITVVGAGGSITLQGLQAIRGFTPESRILRTLRYR